MRGQTARKSPHVKRLNSSRRKFRKFQLNDARERIHDMDSNDMLTVDLTESHSSSQLLTPKMPPVKRSPSKSFKQMRFGNQKNQGVFVTELSKNKADNSVICLDSDSDDSDGDSGSRNFEAPVDLPNNSNNLSNAEVSSSLFEDRMKTFEPPAPTLDDTQSSVDLFYIDKSTSFKRADVPSYKSLDLSLSPLKIQENQKSNLPVLKVADCETFSSVDFSINENIRSNSDDSVIFMGEIPGTSRQNAANFIPLPSKSWSELLKTSNMPNVVPKIPIAQKSTLQTKKCRRRAKKR